MTTKVFSFGPQINLPTDIWIKITNKHATLLELVHSMKLHGTWVGPVEKTPKIQTADIMQSTKLHLNSIPLWPIVLKILVPSLPTKPK